MNTLQTLSLLIGLLGSGGLIGLLVWLWKSGKYFGALEEKLNFLPKLEEHIGKIDAHLSQVTNAIIEMQTHMNSRGYMINQKLAVTNASPTRLTDYGEQLMQESGFYQIIKEEKGLLVDLVRAKNPRTDYDIQEFSLKVLQELATTNNPVLFPLKNYAFQKGLVLDIILQAAGIVLRDNVIQELKFDDATLEKSV